MDLSKAVRMEYFRIGAIGSRRFYCYDINSEQHEKLKSQIFELLLSSVKLHKNLYGYSGLNLGLEQDFLMTCLHFHIPYEIILPYQNSIPYTENDEFNKNLDFIIENANKLNYLSHNIYSVKKNFVKRKYILDQSDLILCNDQQLSLETETNKRIIYV